MLHFNLWYTFSAHHFSGALNIVKDAIEIIYAVLKTLFVFCDIKLQDSQPKTPINLQTKLVTMQLPL